MKKFVMVMAVVMLAAACGASAAQAAEGRVLVAYFSWSGNTESVAKVIAGALGADLFRIETAEPYPEDYDATLDVAKAEQRRDARPELSAHVRDMGQYDTVFLGYPNWWGTLPMALFTFIEAHDLSSKRVIPFVTHGGSSFGRSLSDIKKLAPKAELEEKGLSLSGSRVGGARDQVLSWLKGLGFAVKK